MSIVLEHLTKRYENYPVVNNVSLEVGNGEFFVLLGSSGSGKTTVLSMIAGLVSADGGRILLHGRDVTSLPVQQRKVGFVFQNYALFQHMSVADNVEFGLSIRKVPAQERHKRCDELLELVGLAGLGRRLPRQLSGGQQQRVALARALAHHPDVLLLDEPLGALDAKIRVELRRTLKEIQRKLGIAAILVTHDQEEAFDLGDRIGVMSYGRLLEVGTPEELYRQPETEFVATFLGTGNLLVGEASDQSVRLGSVDFALPPGDARWQTHQRVQVLFRPEDVVLAQSREQLGCDPLGCGTIQEVSFSGAFERIRLVLPPIPGVRPIAPKVTYGSKSIGVEAARLPEDRQHFPLSAGSSAWIGVSRFHALLHPGLNILVVTDGLLRSQAVLALGGQIARMAHARVTLLGCSANREEIAAHLQEARKILGSGMASLEVQASGLPAVEAVQAVVEGQPFDLVILPYNPQEDIPLVEELLQFGEHHILLVPVPQSIPEKALISVIGGEPGKDAILFAGRLLRHLGTSAVLMSVQPGDEPKDDRVQQFLDDGIQSLRMLDLQGSSLIRTGPVREAILDELRGGGYGLLVLGSPLPNRLGKITLEGLFARILQKNTDRATLIVRSRFVSDGVYSVIREKTRPVSNFLLKGDT